jgi:Zn-dependent protease
MSAVLPAPRVRGQGIVLARYPVPIAVGKGSLVPLSLLAVVFALFNSGAPTLLVLGAAALGGLGGAASLIVHELGHVGAARRLKGVKPVRVSLLWFGAGTRFEGAYRSGRDQARVAIGGPAASLALAVVLLASALLPMPRPLALGLFGLAFLNGAIAVVSLLPVQPLDGHNLLVGLLWRLAGSEQKARTSLRRVGRALLGLEAVGCAALMIEKPLSGSCVLAVAAALYLQKQLTARPGRSASAAGATFSDPRRD